ncbi:hypothetical protein [Acetobacter lovaniensis]|uniref:Uncharacterized protein n=1 Tax=Acetobacter lovaniensis TaxID=104100 RepID=A0A841QKF6_9PROT|nr:hypothetical protein [Acetobacter lovaniensis]MBB6458704.1 hypothetical protein [Acetobacter lovaniensis]NHN82909.1 hypothetical protein [Acetobacter lovaniensis]GBQ66536.1 hypothetical protein AA0474_1147 [Acetobacter lovaniensis NRIC 0474]
MSMNSDVMAAYPARYYATLSKPCAWYDMWIFSSTDGLPAASTLFAMTADQWAAKGGNTGTKSMAVENGQLVDYTPPVVPISLATQASTALASARTYIYNNYGILNEVTPDAWVTYIKALMAISDGTDTTSTVLPTQPTD